MKNEIIKENKSPMEVYTAAEWKRILIFKSMSRSERIKRINKELHNK
jgi:hypothetical protein